MAFALANEQLIAGSEAGVGSDLFPARVAATISGGQGKVDLLAARSGNAEDLRALWLQVFGVNVDERAVASEGPDADQISFDPAAPNPTRNFSNPSLSLRLRQPGNGVSSIATIETGQEETPARVARPLQPVPASSMFQDADAVLGFSERRYSNEDKSLRGDSVKKDNGVSSTQVLDTNPALLSSAIATITVPLPVPIAASRTSSVPEVVGSARAFEAPVLLSQQQDPEIAVHASKTAQDPQTAGATEPVQNPAGFEDHADAGAKILSGKDAVPANQLAENSSRPGAELRISGEVQNIGAVHNVVSRTAPTGGPDALPVKPEQIAPQVRIHETTATAPLRGAASRAIDHILASVHEKFNPASGGRVPQSSLKVEGNRLSPHGALASDPAVAAQENAGSPVPVETHVPRGLMQPMPSGAEQFSEQDTFSALDAGVATGHVNWTHASPHHAEAGFADPELGWVSVRADLHGGGMRAVVAGSTADSSSTLGGELAGLSAHLADRQIRVESVAVANAASHEMNFNQAMQQGRGERDGNDTQPGYVASVTAAPQVFSGATDSETSGEASELFVARSSGTGRHISVRV